MGIAAIISPIAAAVAQIQTAKIKADADKFIAKTAADAAITQTKIQSNTTKQLAADQREVAEKNTQATKEIAELQQSSSTQRLSMQLAVLKEERDLLSAERAEIRQIEEKRAQEQIAFAKEQADQQIALQKRAALFQFAASSLSLGGPGGTGQIASNQLGAGAGGGPGAGGGADLGGAGGGAFGVTSNQATSTQVASSTSIPPSTTVSRADRIASVGGSRGPSGGGLNASGLGGDFRPRVSRGASFTNKIASATIRGIQSSQKRNRRRKLKAPTTKPGLPGSSTVLLSSLRSNFNSSSNSDSFAFPRGFGRGALFGKGALKSPKRGFLSRPRFSRGVRRVMSTRSKIILGSTRAFRNRIPGFRRTASGLQAFSQSLNRQLSGGRPHARSNRLDRLRSSGKGHKGHVHGGHRHRKSKGKKRRYLRY